MMNINLKFVDFSNNLKSVKIIIDINVIYYKKIITIISFNSIVPTSMSLFPAHSHRSLIVEQANVVTT